MLSRLASVKDEREIKNKRVRKRVEMGCNTIITSARIERE
jgi:hypothetical protein